MKSRTSPLFRKVIAVVFISVMLGKASAAELREAAVTESFKTVSYQSTASSAQKAATKGTVIHPTNIVRTGVDSRAELEFNDKTITRMGANSVFSFDEKNQTMDLAQGAVLFSKPKNGATFEIATPAATCSISGTTGFTEYFPPTAHSKTGKGTMLFGLIEGKTNVTVNGKTYPMASGELLVSTAGAVKVVAYDLTGFVRKAGLVNKFRSVLPNQKDIQHALDHYADMSRRGFVEPTAFSFALEGDKLALLQDLGGNSKLANQSVAQIASQVQGSVIGQMMQTQMAGSTGGFTGVGASGTIRGQLVWSIDVDLDLRLILPGNAGDVGWDNHPVPFNNGHATADLDVDDTGPVVNGPNGTRVENIVVTGVPASGAYQFYAQYYSGSGPANYTLTATGNGGVTTQSISGTLTTPGQLAGQKSPFLTITH